MVTSFYISTIARNKKSIDFEQYYRDLFGNSETIKQNLFKKTEQCQICLKTEKISVLDMTENLEVINILKLFCNIDQNNDCKVLCHTCHRFINVAIMFKKIATASNEILKQTVKEEFDDQSYNTLNDDKSELELCDKKYNSDENLNGSQVSLEDIKIKDVKSDSKINCEFCNKVIKKSYYKEHLTLHDPDHKKYVCDVCGKSFRLRCAYHNHSLRHGSDFPYKCNFCPYRGRYRELLKTHMRTHTGEYRYMCTECPARFLVKSNLNSHMLKHKEPQYKCDSCKRAFHTQLLMKRHYEDYHLGIRNHVCNLCDKAFGSRNAMMKHQRRVHKRAVISFGRMPSYLQAQNESEDPR